MTTFGPHIERLAAVAATPSGDAVLVGGERDLPDGARAKHGVHVLRVPELSAQHTFELETPATALACADDGGAIAGLADGTLRLLSLGDSPRVGDAAAAHGGAVRAIATWGERAASVGDDGVLHLWTLSGGALRAGAKVAIGARPLHAVAFDARGERVVVGGEASEVAVVSFDAPDADPRRMTTEEGVRALLTTDDGRVVIGLSDGRLYVGYLDGAPDLEHRSKGIDHDNAIVGLAMGPLLTDDANRPLPRKLYSVGRDAALRAWDLDSRKRPKTTDLGGDPSAMAWVPAAPGATSGRAGGLVVVGKTRRIDAIALGDDAAVGATRQVKSKLAELAAGTKASAEKARKAALDAIVSLPEDDARRLLDRSLGHDKSADLRAHAATLISRSGRRASRAALRAALSDGSADVRKAALDALSSLERDRPLVVARAALASTAPDMRVVALARLPMLRQASPLVPGLIASRLADGNPKVRFAALDALVTLEGKGSVEPYRVAFARGTEDVKVEALHKLARAGLALSEGAELVEGALDDDAASVRQAAVSVAIGTRKPLADALTATEAAKEGVLAKQLADAEKDGAFPRNDLPLEEAKEPLFAMLACRHIGSALAGASALSALGDPRATGALLQLSRHDQPGVRRAAIQVAVQSIALGVGAAPLRGRVEWLLADADEQVRSSAFAGLESLVADDASAKLDLAELGLRSPHPNVRRRALQILVAFGGDGPHAGDAALSARADEWLGHALDDEDAKTRDEAFRTLWAWHSASPEPALTRGARARHADLRGRVTDELLRLRKAATDEAPAPAWVEPLLVVLASDGASSVAQKAYLGLLDLGVTQSVVHDAALRSTSPEILALACKRLPASSFGELRTRVLELVDDERQAVHLAAIECFDRCKPGDEVAFARAFESVYYELRVRALELCGKRRDRRCIEPGRRLLGYPAGHPRRPSDAHRLRIARALADTGVPGLIPFFVSLLADADGYVAEQGARGMATAVAPGGEAALVASLGHDAIAVRSWLAEGLARLGDPRGLPVLIGTLQHDHRPIRLGAIMGFVALGAEGAGGLLMALDDPDREIQELAFGVIVARDLALADKDLPADLLESALSSSDPEIRFAAARLLEDRGADGAHERTREIIGPRRPAKAGDMEKWPAPEQQEALLNVVVRALASDDPPLRYAATQLLALRSKPLTYWQEAARLQGPRALGQIRIPHTTWSTEAAQPRKKSWLHSLVRTAAAPKGDGAVGPLVFGVYAGLVRQAPAAGAADETHRIRRDALARIEALAPTVGREAAVPVLRRGLSDPNHLVRKAAAAALEALHPGGPGVDATPYRLMLAADAPDVGKNCVDELIRLAKEGDEAAKQLVVDALEAAHPDVRSHTLAKLPGLYPAESLEPWLLALDSRFADVRLQVVDRLVASAGPDDTRVAEALGKAMESDRVDLQLKAAVTLANRGDARTVSVLAGLLRDERANVVRSAQSALVTLAKKQDDAELRDEIAAAFVARFTDDPENTADKNGLLQALGQVGSKEAGPLLRQLLNEEGGTMWSTALQVAQTIARLPGEQGTETLASGRQRIRYDESWLVPMLDDARRSIVPAIRSAAVPALQHFEDPQADATLAALTEDRDEQVRVQAVQALAFRAVHLGRAQAREALAAALRVGQRELVLPAALALAEAESLPNRTRDRVLQSLLLVLEAGMPDERPRAVLGLGTLGDGRALERLEQLTNPADDATPEDRALLPVAVEAQARLLTGDLADDDRRRVREYVERMATLGAEVVRLRALAGLSYVGDDGVRALLERLAGDRHESRNVRSACAKALGVAANPASEAVLADMLKDGDWQLRKVAREALGKLFPEDETRVQLHALQSPYADTSNPAAAYLARQGDPEVLLARLSEIEDHAIRARLRTGLLRRGLAPTDALRRVLEGDAHGPREDAAWMARDLGDASLAPVLLAAADKALSDIDPASRRGDALGALRACLAAADKLGADVTDVAKRTLAIGDARTVRVVREARALLLERLPLAELEPWLDGGVPSDRALTARVIARRFPDQTLAVLGRLHAPDPSVAQILASASDLGAVFDDAKTRTAALPALLDRGEDTLAARAQRGDEPSRLAAIAALGRGGADDAKATLQALLDEDGQSETIRKAAYKALRRVQRRLQRAARFSEVNP